MRWKWILGLIGLLIVVLIGVSYIIVVSYDYNKLKPMIGQAVREATGRELTLGGDIKVGIGFSPSLGVEKVSFQNAPWGPARRWPGLRVWKLKWPFSRS